MDGDSVWEAASLTKLPAPEHKHVLAQFNFIQQTILLMRE